MFWSSVMMDASDVYIGRSQYDAPEIDGEVFIIKCTAGIGEITKSRITHAFEFDLSGEGIVMNLANRITLGENFSGADHYVFPVGQDWILNR